MQYKYHLDYTAADKTNTHNQDLLQVVSCMRTATSEGYSFIQAVVQLNNDGKMQGVNENVRLHFSFLREPQHRDEGKDGEVANVFYADADEYFQSDEESVECSSGDQNNITHGKRKDPGVSSRKEKKDAKEEIGGHQAKKQKKDNGLKNMGSVSDDDEESAESDSLPNGSGGFKPKTIITYKVEYSIDFGKTEKLFGIDIYAAGEFPSVHEAIPMMEGGAGASDAGSDGDDNINANDEDTAARENKEQTDGSKFEDIGMLSYGEPDNESTSNPENDADRFGAFVDPENIVVFLDRLNMNFNEKSVFYFLLMFPFYEHEWDISGFLLASLFDEEEEEWGDVCLPCNDNK